MNGVFKGIFGVCAALFLMGCPAASTELEKPVDPGVTYPVVLDPSISSGALIITPQSATTSSTVTIEIASGASITSANLSIIYGDDLTSSAEFYPVSSASNTYQFIMPPDEVTIFGKPALLSAPGASYYQIRGGGQMTVGIYIAPSGLTGSAASSAQYEWRRAPAPSSGTDVIWDNNSTMSTPSGNEKMLTPADIGWYFKIYASHASYAGKLVAVTQSPGGGPASMYAVGERGPAGGYITYVTASSASVTSQGWKYLEVAPGFLTSAGVVTSAIFGGGIVLPSIGLDVASAIALGKGSANTKLLINYFSSTSNSSSALAAKLAASFRTASGGYSDWFLPNIEDLKTVGSFNSLSSLKSPFYSASGNVQVWTALLSAGASSASAMAFNISAGTSAAASAGSASFRILPMRSFK
ncbi:MAG: hypothetical protein LBD22_03540 [Spirochaetaceae bacterium]|jgi:hypothetical protein|nr:hypothetical protein [Spirochaetaceae bacterium]